MPTSDGNTWGGRITARTGEDLTTDLQTITDEGFTVLGQDARAGETTVWVYGTASVVGTWITDTDLKLALPGLFFPIPKGEEVTLARVKQWTAFKNYAY